MHSPNVSADTIKVRNQFNALLNRVESDLFDIIKDWTEKKVWKTSGHGGAVSQLEKAFALYCQSQGFNQDRTPFICLTGRYGSLNLFVRATCYPGGEGKPQNLSTDLYLGRFDDSTGKLTRQFDTEERRTNYTLDEINSRFAKISELEERLSEVKRSVRHFTRH
jgi:hypothetical protein